MAINAQEANVKGGEFEFLFRPNTLIEFSGFWSHTKGEFDEFIAPGGIDLSSSEFARTPENTYSLSVRLTPDIPAEMGGLALGATAATAVFGGFTPWIAELLVARTGSTMAPGAMIAVVAVVVVAVLWRAPETAPPRVR